MKKSIVFLIFAFAFGLQNSLEAKKLTAFLDYIAFCTEDAQSYVEFTFIIDGGSVCYAPVQTGYEAEVEIKVVIEQKGVAIDSLHYLLSSQSYKDSLPDNKNDFADRVDRPLANGDYIFYFTLTDRHCPSNQLKYIDIVNVNFPDNRISTSKIVLLDTIAEATGQDDIFVKYDVKMPPAVSSFYARTRETLPLFMEIYHADKTLRQGENLWIRSTIHSLSTPWGKLPNTEIEQFQEAQPVNILLQEFDIRELPSGIYQLVVEILTLDTVLHAADTVYFKRSNPIDHTDYKHYSVDVAHVFVSKYTDSVVLKDMVASLLPIASPSESDYYLWGLDNKKLVDLQSFFYLFWIKRSPSDPEEAWNKYKQQVDYVQKAYGCKHFKGYYTERGRVFLKYGAPSRVDDAPFSPNTYTYEIWHYYFLDGEANVKFVFYNTDPVTCAYELLHSTKRGERYDPSWQLKLMKGNLPEEDFDIKKPEPTWGNRMDKDWMDF
ncbi:MAG: GWxTD domain-containing protein [Bacteroidales bacterium]|jgi:GWxTD domain-containing protein|nr:GWxTD domain-containing protein [Bacteroidales bacterium]